MNSYCLFGLRGGLDDSCHSCGVGFSFVYLLFVVFLFVVFVVAYRHRGFIFRRGEVRSVPVIKGEIRGLERGLVDLNDLYDGGLVGDVFYGVERRDILRKIRKLEKELIDKRMGNLGEKKRGRGVS